MRLCRFRWAAGDTDFWGFECLESVADRPPWKDLGRATECQEWSRSLHSLFLYLVCIKHRNIRVCRPLLQQRKGPVEKQPEFELRLTDLRPMLQVERVRLKQVTVLKILGREGTMQ